MRHDLRLAWRSLRQSPTFALTGILTLAIGLGGSTAIFSVVNTVVWRPLPFAEPDRLVRIWESNQSEGRARDGVSGAAAADWKARSAALEDLALFAEVDEPVVIGAASGSGPASASQQARHAMVTSNFFALLGVQPGAGRVFSAAPGGAREVILSHEFWQRAFGGDTGVVGRPVNIEGRSGGVVVGVLPAGFALPSGVDVWSSFIPGTADRGSREYGAIARLKHPFGISAAEADLQSVAAAMAREFAATNSGWSVTLTPLQDAVTGPHRLSLLTLFAAVALVTLMGCANLSNLLLARGIARQGELAVRTALGASRLQVARLLVAEAIVIAFAGGAAGWLVALAALPGLLQLADATIPRLTEARLDLPVLAFCAGAATLSAVLAGLVPALRLSRPDLQAAMRPSGERVAGSGAEARLQRLIVAGELATCLVLLLGAMLFTQTFVRLNAVDLGFDSAHVLSIDVRMPLYRAMTPDRWQRLATETSTALERVRAIPGVEAASATSDPPLSGRVLTTELSLAGGTKTGRALYHRVSPGYFRTLGMTLLQGRDFTIADASDLALLPDPRAGKPRPGAVIVNETTAKTFWPAGDAIGQFLSTSFDMRVVSRREVVGIVRDVVSETRRGDPPVEVYVPYLEDPSFATTLLVRTQLPGAQIVPVIRREIEAVSADLSVANARMLDSVVAQSMASPRFGAVLASAFAGAALLLAAVGVYGVCAFGVSTRVREIGIRTALGATRQNIVALFLKEAAGPMALGLIAGAAGAVVIGRLVTTLLFGVSATDTGPFALAVAIIVAIAALASYLPVRRALRRNPIDALR